MTKTPADARANLVTRTAAFDAADAAYRANPGSETLSVRYYAMIHLTAAQATARGEVGPATVFPAGHHEAPPLDAPYDD